MHEQVKKRGITYNEVRDYVRAQEATQLFMKPKRIKNFFPIVAKHKYEILQVDLIDFSNIATANENYKYLFVCIDVFSRQVFIIPLKNRNTEIITDAIDEVVEITAPSSITSDNEFGTHAIKNYLKERGINLQTVDVGEHHKLGIVNRFCRTIREKINKYMVMYNTRKYINVLPKLVYNYNSSYHSGIKKVPNHVEEDDEDIINLTNKKYNKAKLEETKFNIGDMVRFIINKQQFEKGTLPHWSKTTHAILTKNEHSYKLDNNKTYKYYELQLVKNAII